MALRHGIRLGTWKLGNLFRRLMGRPPRALQWGRSKVMPTKTVRIAIDPRNFRRLQ